MKYYVQWYIDKDRSVHRQKIESMSLCDAEDILSEIVESIEKNGYKASTSDDLSYGPLDYPLDIIERAANPSPIRFTLANPIHDTIKDFHVLAFSFDDAEEHFQHIAKNGMIKESDGVSTN